MTDVIICSAAEAEYASSLQWYADRSLSAADAFDNEFDRSITEIASDPDRFPRCDERHQFFLMKRYPFRIIYRPAGTKITIIAVAHTSRAPGYWADR